MKANRNTHRHKGRNTCKQGDVKIIKLNKNYKTNSILIRFDCQLINSFRYKKYQWINKCRWIIREINKFSKRVNISEEI